MTNPTDELLKEREKTHGDYADTARIIQNIKDAMRYEPGWENLNAMQKESLEMVANKIGRIIAGNPSTRDHWDDIAGYSRLISQRIFLRPSVKDQVASIERDPPGGG